MRGSRILLVLVSLIVLLLFCICLNLSRLQEENDADTLLPALISTERWSPFYWGENRYGMLVPLLALPVRDVRINLLFQSQIMILGLATLTVIYCRYFGTVRPRNWTDVLADACLVLVAFFVCIRPSRPVAQILLAHPYVISMALLLFGLAFLLREERFGSVLRTIVGTLLTLAALWINVSILAVGVALIVLLPPFIRSTMPRRVISLIILAAGYVCIRIFADQYPHLESPGLAPPSEWVPTLTELLSRTALLMVYPWRLLTMAFVVLVLAVRRRAFGWSDEFAFLVAGVGLALVIAASNWPAKNGYEPRYWTIPLLAILLPQMTYVARTLRAEVSRVLESEAAAVALCALTLAIVTLRGSGTPSITTTLARLDAASGKRYPSVQRLRCTHLVGDYWFAWESVFYNRSHALPPKIWAVTGRGGELMPQWYGSTEERRYCGLCGNAFNAYMATQFKLPALREVQRDGDVCRLAP